MVTGIAQFVYCLLVGTFPYNSFLAGFGSTVGQFVLAGMFFFVFLLCRYIYRLSILMIVAANLRIQSNPDNAKDFPAVSRERAFADFVFCSLILHLIVVNFMG